MGKLFDVLGLGSGKKNFYVRDFRNAYQLRPDNNPPRLRFEGYVNFIINRALFADTQTEEFRTQISSLVKTATLPGVEFKTEVKNRYNSKKIIQTGVEYKPVSMSVLDTVGNEWLTLFMKYYSYNYMNPRNKQKEGDRDISDRQSLLQSQDISSKFGGANYNSNSSGMAINRLKYFFERIDYVLYHGERAVQYSLLNPVLKSFDPGDLDYSSSDVMEFKLDFDYENFTIYNETNFVMTVTDLARFENASQLEGPAFEPQGFPLAMEKPIVLGTLGLSTDPYYRADQYQIPVYEPTTASDGAITISAQRLPANATYANAVNLQESVTNGGSNKSWFSNLLKGTAENALTAAINGQSVKNAVVGTVVGAAAGALRPGTAATRGTNGRASTTQNPESQQVKPGG